MCVCVRVCVCVGGGGWGGRSDSKSMWRGDCGTWKDAALLLLLLHNPASMPWAAWTCTLHCIHGMSQQCCFFQHQRLILVITPQHRLCLGPLTHPCLSS